MNILRSLSALFIVSLTVSLLLYNDIYSFFKYFLLSTVIQIILYQIYLKIVYLYVENLKLQKIKEFSKQGMEVTCPCHKENKVFIPIKLNSNNDYKCLECNKNVFVNIDVKTFLTTEPIDNDAADVELIKAIEKIKQSAE